MVVELLLLLCVCVLVRVVVGVVNRMGVELLKYFLYDAGGVDGVLMHTGGVGGGASFLQLS